MLKNRRKTTKKRVWQTRKPRSVFENKNLYFFCFPSWKKTKRPEKWKTKNTSPRCFLYFDFVFHRIHQKNHFFLQKSRFKSSNFHSARFSFLTSFLRHQLLILLFPHDPRLSIYLLYVWWRVIMTLQNQNNFQNYFDSVGRVKILVIILIEGNYFDSELK